MGWCVLSGLVSGQRKRLRLATAAFISVFISVWPNAVLSPDVPNVSYGLGYSPMWSRANERERDTTWWPIELVAHPWLARYSRFLSRWSTAPADSSWRRGWRRNRIQRQLALTACPPFSVWRHAGPCNFVCEYILDLCKPLPHNFPGQEPALPVLFSRVWIKTGWKHFWCSGSVFRTLFLAGGLSVYIKKLISIDDRHPYSDWPYCPLWR